VVVHSQLFEVPKADFHLITVILCECQQKYVSCVFQDVFSTVLDILYMSESESPFD